MRLQMFLCALVAAGTMSLNTGCSTFTKDKNGKKSPWDSLQFWKKDYQTPQKMAVLWSHDILTVAGKPPTRGFGGRIYFYNEKSQTIPVEGELVVFGFDETSKKATGSPESQPDKRFRFTQEQFTSHFSESDLGASYSIWIPWDQVDGMQKEITLLPTFRSSSGQIVQGTLPKLVLPGRTTAEPGAPNYVPPDVQTISYEKKVIDPGTGGANGSQGATSQTSGKAAGQMRTTTINLSSPIGPKQPALNHQGANQTTPTQLDTTAASVNPAVQGMVDQARQRLIAEAFQETAPAPTQAQPMSTAWNPPTVPSASSQATSYSKISAPEWAKPQQMFPNSRVNQSTVANTATVASAQTQHTEAGVDLPPGVQLSPRATAW